MAVSGLHPLRPAKNVERVVALLESSVLELAARSSVVTDRPATLNLLLTDGTTLAASRWGITLHLLERKGIMDCQVCRTPHAVPNGPYRAVVVASEPITIEDWVTVPDRCFIGAADRVMKILGPAPPFATGRAAGGAVIDGEHVLTEPASQATTAG